MNLLKQVKRLSLTTADGLGLFRAFEGSAWRRERLLILCYHGIALDEEHLWRPPLYMHPSVFHERMEILRSHGFNVLPLGEALDRLYARELPERSVAITFDDGGYDFYREAFPTLNAFRYPATVYLTTYYCERPFPIFRLMCSYLLWKGRESVLDLRSLTGVPEQRRLNTETERSALEEQIFDFAERESLSAEDRNQLLSRLAVMLDVDWGRLLDRRVLQLMNPEEVSELAAKGLDVQLHTHRHRSPRDKDLYQTEVKENRISIEQMTGTAANHFCYPSGRSRPEFLPWLREENVVSATTCDPGLANAETDPLLLPRLVDVSSLSTTEFRGWLSGVSSYLPRRR